MKGSFFHQEPYYAIFLLLSSNTPGLSFFVPDFHRFQDVRLDSHCQHICPYMPLYALPVLIVCFISRHLHPGYWSFLQSPASHVLRDLMEVGPKKHGYFMLFSPYRPYRSEPLEYHWTLKQLEYQKSPKNNFYEPDIYKFIVYHFINLHYVAM